MKRMRALLLGLLLAGLAAAAVCAMVSWKVTGLVQGAVQSAAGASGWTVEVQEAQWAPWGKLELKDVRLATAQGGRLHIEKIRIRPESLGGGIQMARLVLAPQTFALLKGKLTTRWELGPIRVDPASWRIRQPLAQELLSAGPVTTGGLVGLTFQENEWRLEKITLGGPVLRLEAEGWLKREQQVYLLLRGDVTRNILEGLRVTRPVDNSAAREWEPFQLLVEGAWNHPRVRFTSGFFTFAMNQPSEGIP